MSELTPPLPPPEDQPPKKSGPLIKLPSGEFVDVFELMEREKENAEAEMPVDLLQNGDLVAFQSAEDGPINGFTFEVTDAGWDELGMTGSWGPSKKIVGKLDGQGLPSEATSNEAVFSGSGWGGSMLEAGVLATSRSPYFFIKNVGELRPPIISNFEVFRRDQEGNLRIFDTNELDNKSRVVNERHNQRLEQVDRLMELLGFREVDFKNGDVSHMEEIRAGEMTFTANRTFLYSDERYEAQYEAGMAMGNQLAIYDKDSGQLIKIKYYNFKNKDVLQIGYVNLSDHDLDELFISGRLCEDSSVHISGEAITTFTTSVRYGLEALDYKPSIQESAKQLGVPPFAPEHDNMTIYSPHIQVFTDGRIEIPPSYPLIAVEDKHPGLYDSMRKLVSAEVQDRRVNSVSLNGKQIKFTTPEQVLDELIRHFEQTSQAGGIDKTP